MAQVRTSIGTNKFPAVKQAMREVGIEYEENCGEALIVWTDSKMY